MVAIDCLFLAGSRSAVATHMQMCSWGDRCLRLDHVTEYNMISRATAAQLALGSCSPINHTRRVHCLHRWLMVSSKVGYPSSWQLHPLPSQIDRTSTGVSGISPWSGAKCCRLQHHSSRDMLLDQKPQARVPAARPGEKTRISWVLGETIDCACLEDRLLTGDSAPQRGML